MIYNTVITSELKDASYDALVIITDKIDNIREDSALSCVWEVCEKYFSVNARAAHRTGALVLFCNALPHGRLVLSLTGPLNRDYDDVRRVYDAGVSAMHCVLAAGARRPLVARTGVFPFATSDEALLYGCFQALYVPLEIREDVPERRSKVDALGLFASTKEHAGALVHKLKFCAAVEEGRVVCRDIGGSDPERMAPTRVEEYVLDTLKDSSIKMEMISSHETLKKTYPLLAAVDRAANLVKRHQGRVIHLTYEPSGPIEKTLFIVGKGICYDTGGADVKAGGHMAGMHRDKCGAAAVAGLFKTLSVLQPKGLKVHGAMSVVRNSIGVESYVADEIITSRAGKRVRVGNTDAEGRMVMADVLCHYKELALHCLDTQPELFTWATLTGHVVRAYGEEYAAILSNGPARHTLTPQRIGDAGDQYADLFEVSTIRREDFQFHTGKSEYEDILQCNNLPSTLTNRGHQSPAAFLIMASGLDAHGGDSAQPLSYSHCDIAGSSGPFPGVPTGSPIMAFAAAYILPRL